LKEKCFYFCFFYHANIPDVCGWRHVEYQSWYFFTLFSSLQTRMAHGVNRSPKAGLIPSPDRILWLISLFYVVCHYYYQRGSLQDFKLQTMDPVAYYNLTYLTIWLIYQKTVLYFWNLSFVLCFGLNAALH